MEDRMISVKAPRRPGWVRAPEYVLNHDSGPLEWDDSGSFGSSEPTADRINSDKRMSFPGASTAADWDCGSEEKTMPSVHPWAVRAWMVIFLPRTCRAEDERSLVRGDSDPAPVSWVVEFGSWSTRAEDDKEVIPVVVPVVTFELSPKSGGGGDRRVNEENDGIAIKRGAGQLIGRVRCSSPDRVVLPE
jgi:hypothetical protein